MIGKVIGLLAILVITASISPVFALTELEKTSIIDPKLVNAFGSPLGNSINVDQQVQISSDVMNNQEKSQKIAYLVQVKNESGFVVTVGWVVGIELNPHQQFKQSISWIPKESGIFTAEIYVWEGFPINHNALSDYTTIQINVS
ncbi:MAG: hypothetical protein ACW9XH_05870 [Candidatus Nitrosopumilus sp. bin_32a]